MKINLLIEKRFGSRKRGSNTIPVKILQTYDSNYDNTSKKFINFYRMPELKVFDKNLVFTYSKSIEELKKNKVHDINKREFWYLRNKNKIISNGFMYSKYYNMQYYPSYFYKIMNLEIKKDIFEFRYGFYNRPEYQDEVVLKKFIKENDISKKDILIFGKSIFGFYCVTDQYDFFNNFKTYLINNEENDAVSNTLLECIYYKKNFLMMNEEAIANDSIELLKAKKYFGYELFFKKLNNLNNYCWDKLNYGNSGIKLKYINDQFKKSKTFTDFLKLF